VARRRRPRPSPWTFVPARSPLLALLLAVALAACADGGVPTRSATGIHDPLEQGNRRIHAFNKALATAVTDPERADRPEGPVARTFRRGARNVSRNLGAPSDVLNALLQGRVENAGHQGFRFAVNTLAGFGGLLDPAGDMGLEHRGTNFGETLHVWGVGDGPYLELPVLGPSTLRDSAGMIVDTLIDPLRRTGGTPANQAINTANVADFAGELSGASGLVSEILTESADSYAQLRLIFLQNRRFELGASPPPQALPEDAGGPGPSVAEDDPYVDPYDEGPVAAAAAPDPYADPYADPYGGDPYAN
jgi:phospholipid-binding lipoprotein MlaA